jgi:hypothetical protein
MGAQGRIGRPWLLLILGLAAMTSAGQAPTEVSPIESLKERAAQYYRFVQNGDRAAGLDLVAPESRNEYFHIAYVGLMRFSVLDVQLSDSGDTAKVKMRRASKFPTFPQVLEYETVDTWKRIDGQWYIEFPPVKEIDTPFGKMQLHQGGETSGGPSPEGVIRERQNNVNPQQYLQALQNAMEAEKKKAEENKAEENRPEPKKTEDKKPEQKKPEDPSAPPQKMQG